MKNAVSGKEAEVAAAEERCTHLVRLGEQRNQEIKTLQAQLVGVQASNLLAIDSVEILSIDLNLCKAILRNYLESAQK